MSMIAGQTFENFQEIYQRPVKVARVLEETERENQVTNLGKRKMKFDRQGPRVRNPKLFNISTGQDKGKQLMAWSNKPLCRTCGKHHCHTPFP